MKRLKIALMAIAITVSIGGSLAFANANRKAACELFPQYYKVVNWYLPAGVFGYNYYCAGTAGYCTYYRPDPIGQPFYYAPCRFGTYTRVYY